MEGRGGIKLIIDKGKPKRTDLKYYPNWSWLITPRTKEWEEKALIEKYKKLKLIEDDCIIITPTWQDIKKALIDTIKHESMVDASIKRHPDFLRYVKFLEDMSEELKNIKEIDFKENVPIVIKEAKK